MNHRIFKKFPLNAQSSDREPVEPRIGSISSVKELQGSMRSDCQQSSTTAVTSAIPADQVKSRIVVTFSKLNSVAWPPDRV